MRFISTLLAAASTAAAHGFMQWPLPRLAPGDAINGYSIARSASSDPCHGLPPAAVLTPPLAGGSATIDYVITAAHRGGCVVFIDRGNGWESIGSDPNCGTSAHSGQIQVNIPSGDYKAVLRWLYQSDNGSGEQFNTCSDITVTASGTNLHTQAIASFSSCTLSDDMQCTGTSKDPGFQQCAAVNLQGVGTWFQKSCPTGQACLQNVASDPARGVLGKISCVAQGGNSIVQVPVGAPIATATTIQQPVTVSEKIPSSQDSAGLRIIATDPDLPQPTIDSKVEETTMILEATTQDPSTRTIDVTTSTDVPASTTSLTTTTSSTTTASSTTTTSSTSTQDQSIRSIIFTSYSTTTGNRFQASSSTNNPITGTTTPITTATSANTTLISSITVSATKLTSASTETSAVATNNGAVNDFGEAFGDSLTATTTAGPAADKANVGNGGSGSSTPLSGGTVAGIAGASAAVAIAGVVGGVLVIQRRKKSGRSDKNGRETQGESASFRLA